MAYRIVSSSIAHIKGIRSRYKDILSRVLAGSGFTGGFRDEHSLQLQDETGDAMHLQILSPCFHFYKYVSILKTSDGTPDTDRL